MSDELVIPEDGVYEIYYWIGGVMTETAEPQPEETTQNDPSMEPQPEPASDEELEDAEAEEEEAE